MWFVCSCSPIEDFDSSAITSLAIISSYYCIILLKFFLLILYESSETEYFCIIFAASFCELKNDEPDLLVLEDCGDSSFCFSMFCMLDLELFLTKKS